MKTVRRTSPSEDETLRLAAALGEQLAGGELISLEGQLGSGKTCFVRGLAVGLGLDATQVCSPSFIICREYSDSRLKLVHVDAFRLKGPHELDAIGWDELLESDDHVIAVEWPSRIRDALPRDRINVTLEHTGLTSRLITLTASPEIAGRGERQ